MIEGAPDAWVFDVDGCIVDSITGTSLRPLTHDVIARLRSRGVAVVVWSAGGRDYAERRARQLGFDHLVDAFHAKETRDVDGRWRVDHLARGHRPTVFVDDRPEELPDHVRVVGVSPYLAETPHDRGLAMVLDLADRA